MDMSRLYNHLIVRRIGPPARKQPQQRNDRVALGKCETCFDERAPSDLVKFSCGHKSCYKCLEKFITGALRDESMFPPQCCGQPFEFDRFRIAPELYAEYHQKMIEWTAPKRLYCHIRTCSAFISPEFVIGRVGICHQCYCETCTSCKGEAHDGACVIDQATKELMELAVKEGWQQCRKCERMVEKTFGCRHISK